MIVQVDTGTEIKEASWRTHPGAYQLLAPERRRHHAHFPSWQPGSYPVHRGFRHVALSGKGRHETVDMVVCITVYNEPLTALAATLESVLQALQRAQNSRLGHPVALRSCVAIMLDGPEKTNLETLAFLKFAGLVSHHCADGTVREETHFYYSKLSSGRAGSDANGWSSVMERWRELSESVSLVTCVKDRNHGKLHSHALFFGTLCAQWQPQFCFQIDVGTVIDESAIDSMLIQFGRDPGIGGLASRVVSRVPQPGEGFLSTWQYIDFATQAAVFWPAEIVSGHLSFLPGQFCALRWSALSGKTARVPFQNEAELRSACQSGAGGAPLDRYLHGIAAETAFEKIMFLAEDRILGNEVILADAHWRLGFCSTAHTTTDGCDGMGELARQRRRWNNSSTACKLRILSQWRQYLGRENRTVSAKTRFSLAMLWQIAVIFQQIVAPTLLGCMLMMIWRGIKVALAGHHLPMLVAMGSTASIAVAATLLAPRQRGTRQLWLEGLRDVAFMSLGVLEFTLLCGALPVASLVFSFMPMAVVTALTCRIFPGTRWIIFRRVTEYFMFVNPLMQLYLWVYSVLHIDDVTWGTKGITHDAPVTLDRSDVKKEPLATMKNHGARAPIKDDAIRARQLGYARNGIFLGWVLLNACLLYIAGHVSAFYFAGLNPVLEILNGLFVLTVSMACALHIAKAFRRQPAPAFLNSSHHELSTPAAQRVA